ncbi:MAG TPA: sulfate/molybdate ABC transporter ATP-binding protein [Polyangia bacterium]|jgi:sulfate transport system ATP-binding protein|nr:sulfate/molybdate ABC transporter ATP-binding protein [Polyangia bacterium]
MSLVVRNLTKRFTVRGTPAVSDVSFDAPDGGITTLLGPSGSGKSTVLRVVAGLEQPDSGTVRFGEQDFTFVPAQRRGIGFVFQSYALFKHLNVRKNIAFGLRVRKTPDADIDTRVDELLALVQLDGLGGRFPGQLSGGQRQRVAFARALAISPKLLLLDEPFGALDAQVRLELREWLRQFHARTHVTTLLVTHDQEEAMEVSDHVVVMHEGRVAQAGQPQAVYDQPATPFVAAFVGGANVLRGHMRDGRASVGSFAVSVPDGTQAPDGTAVNAFVRPHDVTLTMANESTPEISVARVERLTWLGGYVKIALKLSDGAPMTVQMAKSEIDALGIREGDLVMANLREAKVFVEDYSI